MSFRPLLFSFCLLAFSSCADPELNSLASGSARGQQETPSEKSRDQIEVRLQFEKLPSVNVDSPFFIIFSHSSGQTLSSPRVNIQSLRLWMPSMGHGSAPVRVEALGGGVFRMTNVYFLMPGDWQIQLKYRLIGVNDDEDMDEQGLNFNLFLN